MFFLWIYVFHNLILFSSTELATMGNCINVARLLVEIKCTSTQKKLSPVHLLRSEMERTWLSHYKSLQSSVVRATFWWFPLGSKLCIFYKRKTSTSLILFLWWKQLCSEPMFITNAIAFVKRLRTLNFAASFQGINWLRSALMTLRWFGLLYICV